jgi:hypothetical protein
VNAVIFTLFYIGAIVLGGRLVLTGWETISIRHYSYTRNVGFLFRSERVSREGRASIPYGIAQLVSGIVIAVAALLAILAKANDFSQAFGVTFWALACVWLIQMIGYVVGGIVYNKEKTKVKNKTQ